MPPSKDLIAEIRKPAYRAIQEGWEPALGDWYAYGSNPTKAWLMEERDLREVERIGPEGRKKEELVWVPTLGQIVRLIEAIPERIGNYWDVSKCLERDPKLGPIYSSGNIFGTREWAKEPEIAALRLWDRLMGMMDNAET